MVKLYLYIITLFALGLTLIEVEVMRLWAEVLLDVLGCFFMYFAFKILDQTDE